MFDLTGSCQSIREIGDFLHSGHAGTRDCSNEAADKLGERRRWKHVASCGLRLACDADHLVTCYCVRRSDENLIFLRQLRYVVNRCVAISKTSSTIKFKVDVVANQKKQSWSLGTVCCTAVLPRKVFLR